MQSRYTQGSFADTNYPLLPSRQIRGTEYIFRRILDFENIHQVVKVVDVKDVTSNPVPMDIAAELSAIKEKYYPDHVVCLLHRIESTLN